LRSRASAISAADVGGVRRIAGPCRSKNGLLSTSPPMGPVAPRLRNRSSHSDTISPPAECPYTSTSAAPMASSAASSAPS
jgi:hypothetical protein